MLSISNRGKIMPASPIRKLVPFAEAAKKIDMSNAGPYDQGLNESFQNAFKDYFTGTVDEDTAKANFETAIKEKYPELTDVVWPA